MAERIRENPLGEYTFSLPWVLEAQPEALRVKLSDALVKKSIDFIDRFAALDPSTHDLRSKDFTPIKRTWADTILTGIHGFLWICSLGLFVGQIFDFIVSCFYEDYEYSHLGFFSNRLKITDEGDKSIFTAALFIHAQNLLAHKENLTPEVLEKLEAVVEKYRDIFFVQQCRLSIPLLQTVESARQVFFRLISVTEDGQEDGQKVWTWAVEDRGVKEKTFKDIRNYIRQIRHQSSNQVSSNVQS
jgi:hypothetical protein